MSFSSLQEAKQLCTLALLVFKVYYVLNLMGKKLNKMFFLPIIPNFFK
jgi:hypothetical protein